MNIAVIYYSRHHGNTRKVLDAMAAHLPMTLIDASQTTEADLSQYDLIGFASGIYYSRFHKTVLDFARNHLPEGKKVFFVYTYGARKDGYTAAITRAVQPHAPQIVGEYGCFGFNTFGPFKLIGGIAKGHPDESELAGALRFLQTIAG